MEIHCEWGERGLESLAPRCDVVVIVDVLSFSTSVDIATARGAAIYPTKDRGEEASALATKLGAELATRRGESRFSLSPTCYTDVDVGTRIVLPSPNGGRLTACATSTYVITGCLRNASAVAREAARRGGSVAIVPAGERWHDGSLRPCVEDWFGAGAIAAALPGGSSAEAQAAASMFVAVRGQIEALLRDSWSGRELAAMGYVEDVSLAAQLNVSECVPELVDGAYVMSGQTV